MHVVCPSCDAAYEIPPIERPRRLRCARCGGDWRVSPMAGEAIPAPLSPSPDPVIDTAPGTAPHPAPAGAAERLVPVPRPAKLDREGVVLLVLWIASLAIILGGLASVWHWRHAIGAGWPPSRRLFRLLPGFHP